MTSADHLVLSGAPEGFDAQLVARELARGAPVVHVARDDKRMAAMRAALAFFAPEAVVLTFPAWDCLPYDRISPNTDISAARMACCVTLGYESVDTRANADETARWLARHKAKSVRLVTSDWHMRRAALELEHAVPADLVIVRDAVHTEPSLSILFKEYHKYLARCLAQLWET